MVYFPPLPIIRINLDKFFTSRQWMILRKVMYQVHSRKPDVRLPKNSEINLNRIFRIKQSHLLKYLSGVCHVSTNW